MGLIDGVTDTVVDAGEAALDVPADAVNTTMGACEGGNCGWFGTIDRTLDPRGSDENDFSDESGLWAGVGAGRGALTESAGEVGSVATDPILAGLGFQSWTREGQRQQNQQQSDSDNSNNQSSAVNRKSLALLALAGLAGGYLLLGGGA